MYSFHAHVHICFDYLSASKLYYYSTQEELEAADSHQEQQQPQTIQDGVDASALVGSFDILTAKIDGTMDQLKATALQLEAMGAGPTMGELVRLADEMKEALKHAKAATRLS